MEARIRTSIPSSTAACAKGLAQRHRREQALELTRSSSYETVEAPGAYDEFMCLLAQMMAEAGRRDDHADKEGVHCALERSAAVQDL
mmetsp:Transcript_69733/g.154318  ORF Transcript_69733/g.154318 Transcript_69733/m.154318 type:complete len:87 (-) Transcript_69733:28-288(-)